MAWAAGKEERDVGSDEGILAREGGGRNAKATVVIGWPVRMRARYALAAVLVP